MKILKSIFACALCALVISSCGKGNSSSRPSGLSQSQVDSASYAIGVSLAGMVKGSGFELVNYDALLKGFVAQMKGDTNLLIKEEQLGQVIQNYQVQLMEAQENRAKEEQQKFFAENIKKEGIQETASGLQYQIIEPGNDKHATIIDTIEVNYEGKLLNDKVFDSSYERGQTISFPLNGVIDGWKEGMQLVGEGGKVKLWIPYTMGYGSRALPEIPAFSTLVFDVEVVSVSPADTVNMSEAERNVAKRVLEDYNRSKSVNNESEGE